MNQTCKEHSIVYEFIRILKIYKFKFSIFVLDKVYDNYLGSNLQFECNFSI